MKTSMDSALERIKLANRIAKDAEAVNSPPWLFYKHLRRGAYSLNPLDEMNSATIAEVLHAYRAAENKDFAGVFYTKPIADFVRVLAQDGIDYQDIIGHITVAYHHVRFDEVGRHHYKVSDGLGVLLALTELRGLHVEDLKLPYPAVFIEVPAEVGLRVRNTATGWHPIEGIFIAEDNTDDGMVAGKVNPGRSWRICITSKPYPSEFDIDTAQAFFTLPLVAGSTLDDAIEHLRQRQLSQNINRDYDADVENWVSIWKWAMNVMVYATTPDAEADHIRDNPDAESIWRRVQKLPRVSAKRDALKERLKTMDQKPRVMLGKSVRFTPQLREMLDHRNVVGGPGVLRVRTLVAGHWQRFASGKGRTERVWKFRQPFWRGPGEAPVAPDTEHVLR